MFSTWDNLRQFAEMRRKNTDTTPVLRDGMFGYFNPTDGQRMTSEERFMEDRCIMNIHWPDLMFANMLSEDWPGKKGLGAEFDTFVNNGLQVTWALIFACQLQADILQVRRQHLEYDLQVLRNMGHELGKDYKEFPSSDFLYGSLCEAACQNLSGNHFLCHGRQPQGSESPKRHSSRKTSMSVTMVVHPMAHSQRHD